MSRHRKASRLVGLVVVLALAAAPAVQAEPLRLAESWHRLAGWWQTLARDLVFPERPAGRDAAKIGLTIDPNGAPAEAPPAGSGACSGCSEIGGTIDPNG